MSLAEDILKMDLYKTFEAYINTRDITKRARGDFELTPEAPKEAQIAYAKWRAMKLSKRF